LLDAAAIRRELDVVRQAMARIEELLNGEQHEETIDDVRQLCAQQGFRVDLLDTVDSVATCELIGVPPWKLKRLIAEGRIERRKVHGGVKNRFSLAEIVRLRCTAA
jgi:hypothetical protein